MPRRADLPAIALLGIGVLSAVVTSGYFEFPFEFSRSAELHSGDTSLNDTDAGVPGTALASPGQDRVTSRGDPSSTGRPAQGNATAPAPKAELAPGLTAAEQAVKALLAVPTDDLTLQRLKAALKAARSGRADEARRTTVALQNPAARTLAQWLFARTPASGATPEEIHTFIETHPGWPDRERLKRRAGQWLAMRSVPVARVRRTVGTGDPATPTDMAALGLAYLNAGRKTDAKTLLAAAWREGAFPRSLEARLVKRAKPFLTDADHRWRFDRYMLDDRRAGRRARLAAARRILPHMSAAERKKAEARITIWRSYGRRKRKRRIAAAAKLYAAIDKARQAAAKADNGKPGKTGAATPAKPAAAPATAPAPGPAKDWGYEYHRIQMLRRQGKEGEAWRRLMQAPTSRASVVSPDDWWIERRINAYDALYKKTPRTAYRLVANPGPLSVNALNEAHFMAGWIALRFLHEPEVALRHFNDLARSADGPRTRSSAQYWLGRSYVALQDATQAGTHFKEAAAYFNTFYGQLARQTLYPDKTHLDLPTPAVPDAAQIKAFAERDLTQAIILAHRADHKQTARLLIARVRRTMTRPSDFLLLAELAKQLGDTQMSVRVAKSGLARGFALAHHAYPTHAFPTFTPLNTRPEEAMLYALARQESEFNTLITSIAGARGVLQVMHGTARDVCRTYRLKCGSSSQLKRRLTADPAYNASLAAAYITDRKTEFGGSYVLTFAGYNAGPGRARYWITKSGDPRSPIIDTIDWIELIHIKETRNYIKKVMANLQVYRARLGEPRSALQLARDLERGRT